MEVVAIYFKIHKSLNMKLQARYAIASQACLSSLLLNVENDLLL